MKYSVLKFFIFVGIVGAIASGIGVKEFDDRRDMAKAAGSLYNGEFHRNLRDNLNYEEILKYDDYKTLCIAGVVASILLTSACTVAHVAGKSADEKKANETTNTTSSIPTKQQSVKEKLTELEILKNSKLITEKEYSEMRKEILLTIKEG